MAWRIGSLETPRTPQTPEDELRAVHVGPLTALNGRITLAEYDPAWPEQYRLEKARIRAALGKKALEVQHVGSTSVPGLAAKPIIDILLAVADSADEPSYVPDLEAAGYVLHIREPDLDQHRMFKGPAVPVNLHVWSAGCPEIGRMLAFRDHLRACESDRVLYEQTKRELASRTWKYGQHYADAKSQVVEGILATARARAPKDNDRQ